MFSAKNGPPVQYSQCSEANMIMFPVRCVLVPLFGPVHQVYTVFFLGIGPVYTVFFFGIGSARGGSVGAPPPFLGFNALMLQVSNKALTLPRLARLSGSSF